MKILSFTSVFPNPSDPGRGLFVRARLLRLAELAEVKVIAPIPPHPRRATPPRRFDGPLEVFHPRWIHLPGAGAITPALLFCELVPLLWRLRKEFPFDVIDAHFAFPEGIAAALLARAFGTPFSVTLRGCELLHATYPLRRRGMAWALRRAALVMAVSDGLRQLALELGAGAANAVTIPNGVDADVFHRRDRAECRALYRLPSDRPVILTAGHLIELKGHHFAIEALHKLIREGVSARLVIAGGGPSNGVPRYASTLRRMVADLHLTNEVRFLGPVPQESLAELMAAADVFCMASSREGWPNVVHEALACGTPVVATSVGACPEILASGRLGFVVPPKDPAALADALARALEAPWDRAAISAWAQARSWDRVAAEVLARLREAAAGSAGMTLAAMPHP